VLVALAIAPAAASSASDRAPLSIRGLAEAAYAPLTLEAAPTVTEVIPPEGLSTQSTAVTLKGGDLVPEGQACPPCTGVHVYFGTEAAQVTSGTPQELQVTAPPHPLAGTPPHKESVLVTVSTPSGKSTVDGEFTYLPPPPNVSISFPAAGGVIGGSSLTVTGEAELSSGVSVTLYQGASLATPLETHTVQPSAGHWSTTFSPLGPNTYTLRAEQFGEGGALGSSQPVTFSVAQPVPDFSPPPPSTKPDAPPVAAFTWFPQSPKTNEAVSLVSDSSDAYSALTGFAWSLTGSGAFRAGGPVLTTSFPGAGPQVVRLRVTAADGLSSIASRTIVVSSPEVALMQPFPVVRIAGTDGAFGVKLTLLSVEAPAGAQITVRCNGRGCPTALVHQVAKSSRRGAATVRFSKFERRLPPGVKLVVLVYKAGEIGKYTRFVVRRGKLPKRVDTCLDPAGAKPIACPST
jgi:hypothetical protein